MPPKEFDEKYEPRVWRCEECRRVLGVVMRVVIPGSSSIGPHRARRLWVFRVDRLDVDVPPAHVLWHAPRGLFKVHGVDQAHGVECSICGALNEWRISDESFRQLMSHYGGAR